MKKFLCLFSILLSLNLAAQNPLNYLASTKGGSCYEVCYYNGFLYAGCANTLRVFQLNGPGNSPGVCTDSIRFVSNIDYMIVRNGYLYVCANHDGLWKFDVSNPAMPANMAHYKPASLNESIYDIAFYGDSVFVAAKTRINLLKDNGTSFAFLGTVATYTGTTTRVRGVDVKDSLVAAAVSYSAGNSQDGVYLYGTKGLQQLTFYNDTQGDPQDVYFGENTKLLHVMGGTMTSSSLVNGQYYALDYTIPTNPSLVFSQTINGYAPLGSISMPMNCVVLHDTLYISTQGGGPIGYTGSGPYSGQIYVFDATSPAIGLLTGIYAGLYHFDCDINPATHRMYIASEWYGVLTMDISNIYNETQVKRTNTGGWCHGSARAKNRLAEASEGYGMRLFDVSNMQNPVLIAEDTTRGFSRAISMSDSADYVYGWFLTGKTFRVRSAANLSFVKDTTGDPNVALPSDFKKSRYHNGRVAVIEEFGLLGGSHKILLVDVSIPAQSHLIGTRQKDNIEDLLFHPATGELFTLSGDSIIVFDQNNFSYVTSVKPQVQVWQSFKAFALSNDTLYAFYENLGEGIAKYVYDPGLHTLTYVTASPFNMNGSDRIFMACDNALLYISSSVDSLRAITKTTPYAVVAKYDHGADFVFDNLWGNTDLYYNKGYLFLNEYQGQTSIFGSVSTGGVNEHHPAKEITVYPNPAVSFVKIPVNTKNESVVIVYDEQGKIVYSADLRINELHLGTSDYSNGIYFVKIISAGGIRSGKFIVRH